MWGRPDAPVRASAIEAKPGPKALLSAVMRISFGKDPKADRTDHS